MERQIQQFVIGERRQAGIPGNQGLEARQKQVGSVTGRQAVSARKTHIPQRTIWQ